MIKTKYDITLEIDEQKFELVYVNPSKSKQEDFKKTFETYNAVIEEVQDKQNEIEFLNTQISLNADLIDTLEDKDKKLKALGEQRKSIDKLKTLKDELKILGKKELDLDVLSKERFTICITGDGKEKLIKAIEDKSINYYELMDEIDNLVAKAKEKK